MARSVCCRRYLKTRALTMMHWVDDTDFEEEGAADMLLDENATAALPRAMGGVSQRKVVAFTGVAGASRTAFDAPESDRKRQTRLPSLAS